MDLAPIVILAYNRPEHVARCVAALQRNAEAAESELFVFCDGAKGNDDRKAVEETRRVAREITGFKAVHITERPENWGLARNVIDGVTQVVEAFGQVIVIEDDLVVAPFFLRFMNDALETYRDEEQVGHIQACDFTRDPSLPPTFLIKWTGSWGWATWRRAWRHFNPDGRELLRELQDRHLTKQFDFGGAYRFTRMLRRQTEGKNNSWAIRWNASLFLKDMLSLNVGRSLVSNEGLDGSGTNSTSKDPYTSELWMEPLPVEKIVPIEENLEARHALARYYARTNTLWQRAKQRLAKMLKL